MIELTGKYTSAKIMIDTVDEKCRLQIIEMINHEAFTNPVSIMPDCHSGTGSVIGFTMLVGDKVSPNVVGVDGNCGMLSFNIGKIELDRIELDKKIREKIPFGQNIRKKPVLNFERDIVWEYVNPKWSYEWFKSFCKRIGIDPFYAQCSIGTLGSGNHFIEMGKSISTEDTWVTVHTGSRNLGKKVCEYWQNVASIKDTINFNVGLSEIKICYSKEEWNDRILKLRQEINNHKKTELDYIEGENKKLYLEDMEFSSWYAMTNRMYIMNDIIASIIELGNKYSFLDLIEIVHNYIDPKDNIIRKGAIRSYIGEKMIIPLNMEDGILICEGKSNSEWNFSAPHGAGRLLSRTKAKEVLSLEEYKQGMDKKGIFSTSIGINTLDECKKAYKDSDLIIKCIEPTATIIDRIIPIHNMKDDSEEKPWKKEKKSV